MLKSQILEFITSKGRQEVGLTQLERQSGRENFDFYCYLIWPFCDGAWLAAVSFLCLVPPRTGLEPWVDLTKALNIAQTLGRTLYHTGEVQYFEAINTQVLRNAYARFEEEQIVLVRKKAEGKQPSLIRLADDWTPRRDSETGITFTESRLWVFIDRISQCRREGKELRDNSTLSKRILTLVEGPRKELFGDTIISNPTPLEDVSKAVKRRSRL